MQAWELRVVAGRAVLVTEADPDQGVDPRTLTIDDDLAGSLDEWARVAGALQRADPTSARLITNRGRQLAGRIANATGSVVSFTDPRDGGRVVHDGTVGREPTPWATGLALSGFTVLVVVFGMVVIALTLGRVGPWLALLGNILVTFGLAPTIGVLRPLLVWRWVAYGLLIGITIAWIVWIITLL